MNRLFSYLGQSWDELKKVVWPSRPTAIRLTLTVIVFSLALAAFIGAIDYIFTQALQKLILKG
ncbi:MAG TPA: preprotein translocase subunit SecE [Candidatus Saccharimonadales bacterium]|nr:preprotein translocase subunit SecE [Candidatus Saccharimonadales bacterium]